MQHAQHVPTSVGAATGVYTTSQWLVISGRIRCNSDKPSGITWVFFHFKRNLTACLVNKGYVRDLLGWMMEAMRNRILPWIMTCMKFLCPSAETGTNSRVDAEWVPTSFLLQTSFFFGGVSIRKICWWTSHTSYPPSDPRWRQTCKALPAGNQTWKWKIQKN